MDEIEPNKSNGEKGGNRNDDDSYCGNSEKVDDRELVPERLSEPPKPNDTEPKCTSAFISDRRAEKIKREWNANYSKLKIHMKKDYPNGGFVSFIKGDNNKFKNWVTRQRYLYRLKRRGEGEQLSKISNDQVQRLEAIGFHWEKNDSGSNKRPPSDKSLESSANCKRRKISESHERPRSMQISKSNICPKRRTRAHQINYKYSRWDVQFEKLKSYMKQHYPNGGYVVTSMPDKTLIAWILNQRRNYRNRVAGTHPTMSTDHFERLQAIGFHWEKSGKNESVEKTDGDSQQRFIIGPHATDSDDDDSDPDFERPSRRREGTKQSDLAWEAQFEKLKSYMKKHYPNGGYVKSSMPDDNLARWIRAQRSLCRKKVGEIDTTMYNDRLERLQAIGFQWEKSEESDEYTKSVEEMNDDSQERSAARLHEKDSTDVDSDLDLDSERHRKRQRRINKTNHNDIAWDVQFEKLKSYMKQHCPNGGYVVASMADAKLGQWIGKQRVNCRKKVAGIDTTMSDDRFEKLQAIDFRWEKSGKNEHIESVEETDDNSEQRFIIVPHETDTADDDSESEYFDCIADESDDSIVGNAELASLSWAELLLLCNNQKKDLGQLKANESACQTQIKEHNQEIELLLNLNQDLMKNNDDMMECNQNLRNSHRIAMLEERANIRHECQMRKLVEEKLEKTKQQSQEIIQKLRSEKSALKSINANLNQENSALLTRNQELEKRLEALERHNQQSLVVESPLQDAVESRHSKTAEREVTPSK
ncbi:unnamed protein product [Cylindrotheca closterium]|uniref:Helicase-associated domain-containing protein n=1 Tax=Cylindrotheca closterium TaxID=2856 RepID=A0AAD2FZ18_9STRA|nr:unnamed protein product [Cylindrotheca closterium]